MKPPDDHLSDLTAWVSEDAIQEFTPEQTAEIQADFDAFAAQKQALLERLEAAEARLRAIRDFVRVERGVRDQQSRGGQSVGYAPRISPYVLKELERMLGDSD